MDADQGALPDRQWAMWAALAGLIGVPSYVLLIILPVSPPLAALLACLFSCGFMMVGIGLYFGVTRAVAPRLGVLAAVANTVAGAELTAMLLVQMAVKSAAPHPGSAMTAIWLGLDVAWDVFGGAGTLLLALALWHHRAFRPWLALTGILVSVLLLVFNIATFPTPPAEAGWFDVGPLVALWYVVLCVRVLMVARRAGRDPTSLRRPGADEVPAGLRESVGAP